MKIKKKKKKKRPMGSLKTILHRLYAIKQNKAVLRKTNTINWKLLGAASLHARG